MLIDMIMFRAALIRGNDSRVQTMSGPRDFVVLPVVAKPQSGDIAGK